MNSTVRAFLTATAIAVAVYCFVTWHPEGLKVGDAAPSFSLQDETQKQVSLADYQGKLLIVHFWATWCGTCMQEFPEFNDMAARYHDNPGIAILGISLDATGDNNGWKAIQTLNRKKTIQFKVLMDTKGAVADQFGTYALPETYIVSPDGRIIRKFIGAQDWNSTVMISYLNSKISEYSK
ncbi:MAG: hypothetical protein COV45_03060 [Deltaproteobacteria bacterium CG11_big_fil_rev_8_21_14_0_20_47_16]|nr:MAG: hypothetical protein COV45_03060 [Deltaproteobacteria bacterium CG11_big_fil_rev_8_21_14_0_20_47_16]